METQHTSSVKAAVSAKVVLRRWCCEGGSSKDRPLQGGTLSMVGVPSITYKKKQCRVMCANMTTKRKNVGVLFGQCFAVAKGFHTCGILNVDP